jgi:hypothetical protein
VGFEDLVLEFRIWRWISEFSVGFQNPTLDLKIQRGV